VTTENQNESIPLQAQKAFMQVVMSAEHELQKATQRLRESLGATDEADGRSVTQLLVDRARKERDELELRIETEVKASLARVRAPIDRELEAMRHRMEQLGQKLDVLRRKR
jgi:hypothetical protein